MDEIDIERELGLLQTASDHSEAMIQSIIGVALKGYSYQWFIENWFALATKDDWLTVDEAEFVRPWVETWAQEAYSRLEKETNQ